MSFLILLRHVTDRQGEVGGVGSEQICRRDVPCERGRLRGDESSEPREQGALREEEGGARPCQTRRRQCEWPTSCPRRRAQRPQGAPR